MPRQAGWLCDVDLLLLRPLCEVCAWSCMLSSSSPQQVLLLWTHLACATEGPTACFAIVAYFEDDLRPVWFEATSWEQLFTRARLN